MLEQKRTYLYLIILALNALCATAQEISLHVPVDTMHIQRSPQETLMQEQQPAGLYDGGSYYDVQVDEPDDDRVGMSKEAHDVSDAYRIPVLMAWKNGFVTGYNNDFQSPTAFRHNAGLAMMQQWGKLSLTSSLGLSKGIGNGVGVVNGMNGGAQLFYPFGNNVSLTAMGGINHMGFFDAAPSMTTAYYGGYFTLNTNNKKWGLDLGVRRVYDSVTGRWETIPILMPYYNLGGSKLGIDLGFLLKDAIFGASRAVNGTRLPVDKDGNIRPIILTPPINTTPQIRPLEVPESRNTCVY